MQMVHVNQRVRSALLMLLASVLTVPTRASVVVATPMAPLRNHFRVGENVNCTYIDTGTIYLTHGIPGLNWRRRGCLRTFRSSSMPAFAEPSSTPSSTGRADIYLSPST